MNGIAQVWFDWAMVLGFITIIYILIEILVYRIIGGISAPETYSCPHIKVYSHHLPLSFLCCSSKYCTFFICNSSGRILGFSQLLINKDFKSLSKMSFTIAVFLFLFSSSIFFDSDSIYSSAIFFLSVSNTTLIGNTYYTATPDDKVYFPVRINFISADLVKKIKQYENDHIAELEEIDNKENLSIDEKQQKKDELLSNALSKEEKELLSKYGMSFDILPDPTAYIGCHA